MSPHPNPRRVKLVQPRLQLKLVGSFVGLAVLAMLLQFLVLGARISRAASALPEGGIELAERVPGMLLSVLALSFVVLLPVIVAFGVMITFRIAGPIHRFEEYLADVARGEDIGPCRIRDEDELHELCDRINDAVDSLRARAQSPRAVVAREAVRSAG